MSDAPDPTGPKQKASAFKPGQSGNPAGRPKGSRNKLGEDFVQALHADFEDHGAGAIALARAEDPVAYIKVVASLLPKEIKIEDERGLTDEQLSGRIAQLARALGFEIGAREAPVGTEAPARPH